MAREVRADVSTKGIRPPSEDGMNGVVHHALAFNTLLSSQETDAYSIGWTLKVRRPGRSLCFILFFRCALILSDPLFRVKPAHFQPVDLILLVLEKFELPCFQGNPSNLLHHPVHVESGRLGTQVSQKSGDDQGGFRGPGAAALSLRPGGLYGPPSTSSNQPAPPRRFIRACLAVYLVQGCLDILVTQFWLVGCGQLLRLHRRRQEHVACGSHIASADSSFAQVTELMNDHMLRSGARRSH